MIKIIRQIKQRFNEGNLIKVEQQATALRAYTKVKQHVKQLYHDDHQRQMRAIMDIDRGLSSGDQFMMDDIYNGALMYALRHEMHQEVKELVPMADVVKMSRGLAGKFQGGTPQPELLDEMLRYVELKQVKKIVAKFPNCKLPLANIRIEKEQLERRLPKQISHNKSKQTIERIHL